MNYEKNNYNNHIVYTFYFFIMYLILLWINISIYFSIIKVIIISIMDYPSQYLIRKQKKKIRNYPISFLHHPIFYHLSSYKKNILSFNSILLYDISIYSTWFLYFKENKKERQKPFLIISSFFLKKQLKI